MEEDLPIPFQDIEHDISLPHRTAARKDEHVAVAVLLHGPLDVLQRVIDDWEYSDLCSVGPDDRRERVGVDVVDLSWFQLRSEFRYLVAGRYDPNQGLAINLGGLDSDRT